MELEKVAFWGSMLPTVVTNCTSRKRSAPGPDLRLGSLDPGSAEGVAEAWAARLRTQAPVGRAADLYCGRGFSEAKRAAASLGASLLVASAGLGLIDSAAQVPSYEATVSPGAPDSVRALLTDGTTGDWWTALCAASPFSVALDDFDGSLLLVAVSSAYFEMMRPGLERWALRNPDGLRLFLRIDPASIPEVLRPCLMPYDSRLNDPAGCPGTESDFVQRALADFAGHILDRNGLSTCSGDAERVRARLAPWRIPDRPVRNAATDAQISDLILVHWESVGGRSGRMLRKLRDDLGVACEQGRFKTLFHKVSAIRESGETLGAGFS